MTNPETLVQSLCVDMLHQLSGACNSAVTVFLPMLLQQTDFSNIGGPLGSWSRLTDFFQVRRNQTGETEEGEP